MAISRFNLHALVDQEEEDDEVVELVRVEPPLAHLLPTPSVLFTRFPGYAPSFPRSVYPIQDIPFFAVLSFPLLPSLQPQRLHEGRTSLRRLQVSALQGLLSPPLPMSSLAT